MEVSSRIILLFDTRLTLVTQLMLAVLLHQTATLCRSVLFSLDGIQLNTIRNIIKILLRCQCLASPRKKELPTNFSFGESDIDSDGCKLFKSRQKSQDVPLPRLGIR